MSAAKLVVEVVFARPERQLRRRVTLPAKSTAEDALAASGLAEEFRGAGSGRLGIYGKEVAPSTVLRDGDRVELYRSLRADPKDLRRGRAAKKRAKG